MKPSTFDRIFYSICFGSGALGAILFFAGCTAQELKESGSNAVGAAGDAVGAVAADPSKAFTPQGLAVLVATFVAGFFGRQAVSVAKWAGSPAAGWLVRTFGNIFSLFRK